MSSGSVEGVILDACADSWAQYAIVTNNTNHLLPLSTFQCSLSKISISKTLRFHLSHVLDILESKRVKRGWGMDGVYFKFLYENLGKLCHYPRLPHTLVVTFKGKFDYVNFRCPLEKEILHWFTNEQCEIALNSTNIKQRNASLPSVIQYRKVFNKADSGFLQDFLFLLRM